MNEYNISEDQIEEIVSLSIDKAVIARDEFWKESIRDYYKNNPTADFDSAHDKGFTDCKNKLIQKIDKLRIREFTGTRANLLRGLSGNAIYNKALDDILSEMNNKIDENKYSECVYSEGGQGVIKDKHIFDKDEFCIFCGKTKTQAISK